MGMLVSPYRHAAGGGAAPDFGALVRNSVDQGFSTTAYDAAWDTELYDYNGWHSTSSNTPRLTVISGVSMVRVISNVSFSADDLASHNKNGATFRGMGRGDSEGFVNLVSAPLAVTPGDYFTTNITQVTAITGLNFGTASWMAIEILPASLKYALVYKSGTQALSAGVSTALTFDSELTDTNSFHDTVTNNTRLTVPSGVTLVRLSAQAKGDASGQWVMNINKNGATARGLPFKDNDTTGNDHINIVSAPIEVATGDYFEVIGLGTNATNVTAVDDCWFAIEEVPSTYKRALVYKSSGTQSFTGGASPAAVTWDGEVYDTDSIHDNVTNNSRLTVPSGVTRARPCFNVKTSSVAGLMAARVRKNGSDYHGQPFFTTDTTGTDNLSGMGAWVDVTPGDYFEVFFSCATTCTIGTENEVWFCLECQ